MKRVAVLVGDVSHVTSISVSSMEPIAIILLLAKDVVISCIP